MITETRETNIDVDIDHAVQYGYTLAWELGQHEPPGVAKVNVTSTSTSSDFTTCTST
jgi:hypothetical protein